MTPHESYYDRIRDSKNPQTIRRAMVEFYLANEENTSLTALTFRTSHPTVNKWVHRYEEGGWQGLSIQDPCGKGALPETSPDAH